MRSELLRDCHCLIGSVKLSLPRVQTIGSNSRGDFHSNDPGLRTSGAAIGMVGCAIWGGGSAPGSRSAARWLRSEKLAIAGSIPTCSHHLDWAELSNWHSAPRPRRPSIAAPHFMRSAHAWTTSTFKFKSAPAFGSRSQVYSMICSGSGLSCGRLHRDILIEG